MSTGALVPHADRPLGGVDYLTWRCVDCATTYPASRPGATQPQCNGHSISLCPWCRPDSQPWTAGRGI